MCQQNNKYTLKWPKICFAAISRRSRVAALCAKLPPQLQYSSTVSWSWLWRPLVFLLLLLAMAAYWVPLPPELDKRIVERETLFDNNGKLVISLPNYQPHRFYPVPVEDMGTWVPEMVVALEDHRFFQHRGVDFHALCGSLLRNLRAGRRVSGASTITQQVIKLAEKKFEQRTFWRKIYEVLAAMRLERRWSKMHILEEYLNRLPFGNGIFGVEAAAIHYFGKNCAQIDQREAIFLAGLPQAPSKYNPWKNHHKAVQRYRRCLQRLYELGVLSRELADRYSQQVPVVLPQPSDWGGLEVRVVRAKRPQPPAAKPPVP